MGTEIKKGEQKKMRKKILIPAIALASCMGALAIASASASPYGAHAEGEGSSLTESAETADSSTEAPADSKTSEEEAYEERLKDLDEKITYVKDWANGKWDTYVAPLLGGVSLAVVVSFLGTLAMNYARGKGLDKKMLEAQSRFNSEIEELKKTFAEKSLELDEKIAQTADILANVGSTLETLKSIEETVKNGEKVSEETKEKLTSQVNSLTKSMAEMTDGIECLGGMKKAMVALSQIVSKLASTDPEAIRNGTVIEIKQLAEMTKEL